MKRIIVAVILLELLNTWYPAWTLACADGTSVLEQTRLQAEQLASQAAIFEDTKRYTEALTATGQAITAASSIWASDLLMQEEWRRGRLFNALGDQEHALAALRRAAFHLQTIHSDLLLEHQTNHSSFREVFSPLYLMLADLLLKQATLVSTEATAPLLLEARDTIERLKATELEDYLGITCPLETNQISNLENIAPRTGVLYPILLPDRLELLLGIGKRQYRATVMVEAEKIHAVAKDLAYRLRASTDSLIDPKSLANQLFTWIIAPIKSMLEQNNVDTIVFVPDGPLRLFPIAALMDGDTYLIEHYAIVTAPGLTLFDPQPILRSKSIDALVVGMSRPGPVIDEIPTRILASLAEPMRGFGIRSNIRGRGLTVVKAQTAPLSTNKDLRQALKNSKIRQNIEDSLALPGVEKEVQSISATLNSSNVMLNQNFVMQRFKKAMDYPLRIVHVASHGFFGGTPKSSFFMTYDHLLNMDEMETILRGEHGEPPELLTLSACQTAEGNDRAPLGIVGVAVKSGARSAIGSLWPVSDEATQVLLSEFYTQLRDLRQTKAQALQKAQLMVLHNKHFRHPFFWSAFILVGNWL